MGTTRSRRQERKEETRSDLVAAAIEVFASRGFHASTVEEIAQAAGYTTGALYWHFGSKDGLFLAAFEAYALVRVDEIGATDASAQGGLAARMRALADHWMARQEDDPRFVVVALEFFVHALRNPELREQLATRQAAVRLALGRVLEQAFRDEGVQPPMPAQELATALREQGVGLALARLLDPDAVSERLYGDFVGVFAELAASGERRPAGGAST